MPPAFPPVPMTGYAEYMRAALQLAARNLGQTWPNPAVGTVIVRDGKIIAEGWTARGGRPHAETQALKQAGTAARGAASSHSPRGRSPAPSPSPSRTTGTAR